VVVIIATTFSDIYDLNEAITNDDNLNSLPNNLYYFTAYQYLLFAIAEFVDVCNVDIENHTAFTQETYNFTGDGSTIQYTLSPTPPALCELYVSINDVETTNYTFDSVLNTITFSSTPVLNDDIYIGAYIEGSFLVDLTINEKRILSEAMTIPYIESKINRSVQLDQMVYGANLGIHSQANHNKVLSQEKQDKYLKIHQMIVRYSFRSDPDDLDNLVGDPDWY